MGTNIEVSEREILSFRELLRERGFSQKAFSSALGLSGPYFSRILRGHFILKPEVAKVAYELLGEDPRADYLIKLTEHSPDNPDKSWEMLYTKYSGSLEEAYCRATPEVKGLVLGGLEKLLRECKEKM